MLILFCDSFLKSLGKIKSISTNEIRSLLRRYPNSPDIKKINTHGEYEVLKCYLLGNRVRMIVYLNMKKERYIPIAIIKKESKKGKNIRKDNLLDLFSGDIERINKDIKERNYVSEKV